MKIAWRNISNLTYTDDTSLKSKEELKMQQKEKN